jgi:1-pyrroline-5-carboxylate dehydrogenase
MFRANIRRLYTGIAVPPIQNEPCNTFAPGTEAREKLQVAIDKLRQRKDLDVPVIVNGEEFRPGKKMTREVPSDRHTTFHSYYHADRELLQRAVDSSLEANEKWRKMPFQDRAAIVLKASQLLATSWRYDFQAATMLGQSKNPWQGEIDCVTESNDFFRFNVKYAKEIYDRQPISPHGTPWNMVEYRPLEGFVMAISPFNFTAIGANLATAPALMGNTVVWKPSDTALYSAYLTYKLFEEAGMPPGVINFVPSAPQDANDVVLKNPNMSACVFTGSTKVFKTIWKEVASNLDNYKTYPRVTGETGGKNFHVVHPTAHMPTVAAQTVRSAFEYQGQKCSACSRLFVPKSQWPWLKEQMLDQISKIKQGGPEDFSNFMCANIDEASFNKSSEYIKIAKEDATCTVLAGGNPCSDKGWFVPPTLIETTSLNCRLLKEEIFGPVVTAYVYDDAQPGAWEAICREVNDGAIYGLTGAIFARDRDAITVAKDCLYHAAGNLYINDKSTGAVVGQQPFGGARASGTNDKPGSPDFLQRFVSVRLVKETLEHMPQVSYPHQLPEVNRVPEKKQ